MLERGIPDPLRLNGKLYWSHNFAPPCKNRLAHNVYEIFWFTKSRDKCRYNNRCRFKHCRDGEKNLSNIFVKKEYRKGIIKYPTMLPAEFCGDSDVSSRGGFGMAKACRKASFSCRLNRSTQHIRQNVLPVNRSLTVSFPKRRTVRGLALSGRISPGGAYSYRPSIHRQVNALLNSAL